MADSFTSRLRIVQQVTGENEDTWGGKVNDALAMLEEAIAGVESIDIDGSSEITLTAENNATDQARNLVLTLDGSSTSDHDVIVPTQQKLYVVKNNDTDDVRAVTVKTSAGTGVATKSGETRLLICDGTNVVDLPLSIYNGRAVYIGTATHDELDAAGSKGLAIRGGSASNRSAFLFMGDDGIDHSFTTGGVIDQETADHFAIQMLFPTTGGTILQSTMEDGTSAGPVLQIIGYGGTSDTTDTSASRGLVEFLVSEHDGSNGVINAPANQNAFAIRTRVGGSDVTQLILKGDDGELHLGNATPAALDDEDDVMRTRELQTIMTNGQGIKRTEYDWNNYEHAELERLGLVGPKDERGNFLIKVQPTMGLLMGASWQLYNRLRETEKRLEMAETKLAALPAPVESLSIGA